MESGKHPSIQPLIFWTLHWSSHLFTCPLKYPSINLFIHSLIHSSFHDIYFLPTCLLINVSIQPLSHSLKHPFIHPLIHPSIHLSIIHPSSIAFYPLNNTFQLFKALLFLTLVFCSLNSKIIYHFLWTFTMNKLLAYLIFFSIVFLFSILLRFTKIFIICPLQLYYSLVCIFLIYYGGSLRNWFETLLIF